jgi:nucleoside-diphosphate-sugar epimerase
VTEGLSCNKRAKIAILGSNGQVGAEVAACLSLRDDVDLLCLVRSEFSAVLLRLLAIPYAAVDYGDRDAMASVLPGVDAVVDCTYPGGQPTDILRQFEQHTEAAMDALTPGSTYIHMSSIRAFGMAAGAEHVRHFMWPRNSYAYIKRRAEKRVSALGNKRDLRTFNLRLGQVHGVLQSVTRGVVDSMSAKSLRVRGTPDSPTNTVFASSVAQAVLNCVLGAVSPGLYTVVSSPQWTLDELYDYYRKRYDLSASIEYVQERRRRGFMTKPLRSVWSALQSHRELLETYVLLRMPSLFPPIKGMYRKKEVAREVADLRTSGAAPHRHLLGVVPGPTIPDIRSEPEPVLEDEQAIARFLNGAIEDNRK